MVWRWMGFDSEDDDVIDDGSLPTDGSLDHWGDVICRR